MSISPSVDLNVRDSETLFCIVKQDFHSTYFRYMPKLFCEYSYNQFLTFDLKSAKIG